MPISQPTQDQFAEQFLRSQRRVYAYIVSMLPNRADAEEVFQQTSLILWRKWADFAPARPLYFPFELDRYALSLSASSRTLVASAMAITMVWSKLSA